MRGGVFRAVSPCRRCNLAGVMLQLMALGIPDVMNFDFMSKPSPGKDAGLFGLPRPLGTRSRSNRFFRVCLEAVHSAVEHLELLGAVERKDGQVQLTALGRKMASFPLEPRYAKVNQRFPTQQRFLTGCPVCVCAPAATHTGPRFVVTRPATFCRPSCCPPTTPVPRRS